MSCYWNLFNNQIAWGILNLLMKAIDRNEIIPRNNVFIFIRRIKESIAKHQY
jgi:hypothetical protein